MRPQDNEPKDSEKQCETQMPVDMCCREKAGDALRRRADELRHKADQLARLAGIADSLMANDPAEELLWEFAQQYRR